MERRRAVGIFALGLVIASPALRAASPRASEGTLVYFGTYTGSGSHGIYVSRFDARTGGLSAPELAASTANPSFLAVHPSGRFLYAVNELGEFRGAKAGAASAFAIDPATGMLTFLDQVSTNGPGPCFVSLDAAGRHAFVANYDGGSVAVLPIRADGSLEAASSFVQHQGHGPDADRQEGPHAHEALLDPAGRFLWVDDLGLDKVFAYRVDAAGTPATPPAAAASVAPASGPRHFTFSHDGRWLFVLSEMALTVTSFRVDPASGAATSLGVVSSLPEGVRPSPSFTAAEIQLHPSGRFLYASNRGPDSIAVFSVDERTGSLKRVDVTSTGGRVPRGFAIDPTGRYIVVANQDSNDVRVFAIDEKTGRLAPTGDPVKVAAPVSVAFVTQER